MSHHTAKGNHRGGKVLHLIPTLGGGGAERQLTYLCGHLPEIGWECHVGILQGGTNLEAMQGTPAQLHWLKARSNYDPRLLLQVRRLIRLVQPDVLQTWITMMDIVGGLASIGSGVPWIISERNVLRGFQKSSKVGLVRMLSMRADSIIANSAPGLEDWNAEPMAKGASKVMIANAVPIDRIDEAAREQGPAIDDADSRPLVLFAGRLEPQKNIENTFEAMRIALRKNSEFRIVICGDGSLRGLAEEFSREPAFSGRVEYLGYSDSIWAWMARATVFISLSYFEGMPNAAMEAAALRCPLVLSAIDSHEAIFDASEVLFVPPDDPDASATGLVQTLQNSESREKRALRAYERTSRWTPEATATSYANHYESLLSRRAGAMNSGDSPDAQQGAPR